MRTVYSYNILITFDTVDLIQKLKESLYLGNICRVLCRRG